MKALSRREFSPMTVVDAQVHAWLSDRPSRPWSVQYRVDFRDKPSYLQHAGQTNSPEMALREMAEVGVDRALLTPPGVYGSDIELELEAAELYPSRFKVIGLLDHLDPNLRAHLEASKERGLRGIRMLEMREPDRLERREFDHALQIAADLDLFVMFSLAHPIHPLLRDLVVSNPRTSFFIDHLGTGFAPPILGFRPANPFEHLKAIIEVAELQNVSLKLTGGPSLSFEAYPFRDIWQPVVSLVKAFGTERVAWGSDYTRTAPLFSYWDSVNYLKEIPAFSEEQLELLYGESLLQRMNWR